MSETKPITIEQRRRLMMLGARRRKLLLEVDQIETEMRDIDKKAVSNPGIDPPILPPYKP